MRRSGAIDEWINSPQLGRHACKLSLADFEQTYTEEKLLLSNVFITRNTGKRYLFHKADGIPSCPGCQGSRSTTPLSMHTVLHANSHPPLLENTKLCPLCLHRPEYLYIYGESLPHSLKLPLPDFLQKHTSTISSKLFWYSQHETCSTLHYDLSQGVIMQLQGSKRVYLFPPSSSYGLYEQKVPLYNRQSALPDIHSPNEESHPLFDEKVRASQMVVEISAGQILFIPYGWWHQVESSARALAVTVRWSPFDQEIEKVLLMAKACEGMPRQLLENVIDSSCLPDYVQQTLIRRIAKDL